MLAGYRLLVAPGNILFSPFTTSYKYFKGKFFKFLVKLDGTGLFFDEVGRSKFPLYWTGNSTWFNEWPRSAPSAKEQEIYSIFDKLPRRLPTWKLLAVYKSSQRWATFQGMFTLFYVSVGLMVINLRVLFFLMQIS